LYSSTWRTVPHAAPARSLRKGPERLNSRTPAGQESTVGEVLSSVAEAEDAVCFLRLPTVLSRLSHSGGQSSG
jgi:hypothetical protein